MKTLGQTVTLLVVAGALIIVARSCDEGRSVVSPDTLMSAPVEDKRSSLIEPATSSPSVISTAPEREPSQSSFTSEVNGLVRDGLGQAIADASVNLVWATKEDLEWECAWQGSEWGALDRSRQETRSDDRGGFVLDLNRPSAATLALISASHPRFETGAIVLPVEHGQWADPVEIVLQPAQPMTVVVVDADGRFASGTKVEQFGTTPSGTLRGAGGMGAERARRLLLQEYITGPDGSVAVSPFPGVQVFVARRGDEVSLPWTGAWQARATLRLAPTFEVSGEVSLPNWEHLNYVGERRITIAAQSRNLWRNLATIRSVEEGSWGPIRLPLIAGDRYRVRIEGSPIVPEEWFFPPPTAGARLRHDFAPELGHHVWFRVADEQNQVIPTAVVRVQWQDPTNLDHWNFVERSHNGSGQIEVWSLPPGTFKYVASAPGYVPFVSDIVPVSRFEKTYDAVTLRKAGSLRGRVLHHGKPVEAFEVIVWQQNEFGHTSTETFFDREDGSFELDNAPLGSIWVTASSALTPACEPVAVNTASGTSPEVTLELLDGLPGRGRVLDLATGDPIPNAAIQLFVKGGINPVARWGQAIPVRSDGTFELMGFLPGSNSIRAVAPGYSDLTVPREATGGAIDWGDIAMTPRQELRIVVEPPERAAGAFVLGRGTAHLPGIEVTNGIAVYPEVSAGAYGISINELDHTETFIDVPLKPGDDWTVRTRIAGPNRLSVQAVSEQGSAMSQVLLVEAAYSSSQGHRTIRTKFPDGDGPILYEGIDAPSVTVQVYDMQARPTTARGSFENGELHLEVRLGEDTFLLRVVDKEGEPLPGVRVTVGDPEDPGFVVFGNTDSKGECPLRGIPEREVIVNLQHGTQGSHFGIPVDASARSAELVLDPRARLDLVFLDGELPLAGVNCNIVDANGSAFVTGPVSDEQGHAAILDLGADTYLLKATRPDCWPTEFFAEARIERGSRPVQIRRLGNLELEILAQGGLPVSELPVELTSLEFDTDVATWLAAERVRSAGLNTDIRGRIRVEGLPRGSYRWRLPTAASPLDGVLEIEPGSNSPLRVMLP